jgi:hypothetical protein
MEASQSGGGADIRVDVRLALKPPTLSPWGESPNRQEGSKKPKRTARVTGETIRTDIFNESKSH